MKRETYQQCTLRRITGPGKSEVMVIWIPAKYAVEGDTLRLKEHGEWVEGWKVESVGYIVRDASELPDGHAEPRQHRKNTGDSMPKVR